MSDTPITDRASHPCSIFNPKSEQVVTAKTCRDLERVANQIAECVKELIDLIDAIRSGEYKPDSFTTQPMDKALAAYEAMKGTT